MWYIKINIAQVGNEWNFNNIWQVNDKMHFQYVGKRFLEATFKSVTEGLSMLAKILLLGAYSIYVYKKQKTVKEKKSYKHIIIETIISIMIFAIGLLWMYLTIFREREAMEIASYERYMNTILLSWLTINTLIIAQEDINLSVIYVWIAISVAILPHETIYTKYIQCRQDIQREKMERTYYYLGFRRYEKYFKKEDKIYFISDTSTNNEKVLQLCKYEMMTNNIANKEPKVTQNSKQLAQTLLEENYTYVYIFKVDDYIKEQIKNLFVNEQIKSETLYKIKKDGQGNVQLEKF